MSTNLKIKVLFFAKARELLQISEASFELKSSLQSTQSLHQALEAKWPQLLQFKRTYALALNEDYLDANQENLQLNSRDILAIIPPISGG